MCHCVIKVDQVDWSVSGFLFSFEGSSGEKSTCATIFPYLTLAYKRATLARAQLACRHKDALSQHIATSRWWLEAAATHPCMKLRFNWFFTGASRDTACTRSRGGWKCSDHLFGENPNCTLFCVRVSINSVDLLFIHRLEWFPRWLTDRVLAASFMYENRKNQNWDKRRLLAGVATAQKIHFKSRQTPDAKANSLIVKIKLYKLQKPAELIWWSGLCMIIMQTKQWPDSVSTSRSHLESRHRSRLFTGSLVKLKKKKLLWKMTAFTFLHIAVYLAFQTYDLAFHHCTNWQATASGPAVVPWQSSRTPSSCCWNWKLMFELKAGGVFTVWRPSAGTAWSLHLRTGHVPACQVIVISNDFRSRWLYFRSVKVIF